MKTIGKTIDGKAVVSGVMEFHTTHGVPLELILDKVKDSDLVISWPHFIEEAKKTGWNSRTILSKAETAVVEIYGRKYWDEMSERFQSCL